MNKTIYFLTNKPREMRREKMLGYRLELFYHN